MFTTDVRRTDAPAVASVDADHAGRSRRDESPRPLSGCAACRLAPRAPSSTLPATTGGRAHGTTGRRDERRSGRRDLGLAWSATGV